MTNPAEELLGRVVNDRWTVIQRADRVEMATGGCFSIGYIAEDADGKRAFIKALDLHKALMSPDPARAIQPMVDAFNYERDLLQHCRQQRLDRVVLAIDEGTAVVDGAAYQVQFVVFELADSDIRSHPKAASAFDLAWKLRTLHHTAVGLMQLHGHGIAHQDLRPSNVLVFSGDETKIADLGRAEMRGTSSPHQAMAVAGAMAYAPPEQLYGAVPDDWSCRRFGCDLYLMGSMVSFLFCGVPMTAILKTKLSPNHTWDNCPLPYTVMLPYVRDAYYQALAEVRESVPVRVQPELMETLDQLCDPDPQRRGHPRNQLLPGNRYGLERYVSLFNLLARKAEFGMFEVAKHG